MARNIRSAGCQRKLITRALELPGLAVNVQVGDVTVCTQPVDGAILHAHIILLPVRRRFPLACISHTAYTQFAA